jgi:hypothetical protein
MGEPPDDLNKKLSEFIADMQQLAAAAAKQLDAAYNTQKGMQALHKFACLLVIIAKEADIQTRRIVRLTWALVGLTGALLLFTWFLYKDTHVLIQREGT